MDSERNEREGNERRISWRRGEQRGVRGQRVGVRGYPSRGRRGNNQWEVGHPLNEIWMNDEDVPPELVSLATDVMRKRQMKMQGVIKVERNNEREVDRETENYDEFLDASGGADSHLSLEGQNFHFEWSTMKSFQGQEENFRPERTGSVYAFDSAYGAFRSYWDDDILELIVTEMNLYATKIQSVTFQSEWYPTNVHEILCLFSFWMMLGIIRMPTATSCFSVDPLLKTEVFRRIFTRRRYEMLSRALHFIDSEPAVNNPNPSNISAARSSDRLNRLRPIFTQLNYRFQANYILDKDICLNESSTLCEGTLTLKQFNETKASKLGIRTFELCESITGYLWSFVVYDGKQSSTDLMQTPGELKGTAVVKKLISPLLNKGYRLFMDNWYNSPLLARFLKLNGTDCVGTLRSSCRDVPTLINKAPLKRGEYIARHSGDVSILSWQDNDRVTMISTCHGSATALPTVSSRPPPPTRPIPFKPQMVLDYNKFMRGVDTEDQMFEPYLLDIKRCAKWNMKLFKRLLNVSIQNSRILLESSTQKNHNHLAFRLSLVDSILTYHLPYCPQGRRFTISSSISTHQIPQPIIPSNTHWPVLMGRSAATAARNRSFRKRCFICLREGRKSQKTPYCCETCQVPLCIINCFKLYHTSQ
ncbi:hypothetical protein PYW07_005146 [Mythimna separata]|uniref:PiggyBac transposable element-derived protein 4 n=1 Tax=Mythimna separata TaxID=271217 RepID=A0AAD7YDV3_MYTSE|nr:hypothetical protein PYW07_005146 [Mythimna separata]